ncbi:hypothetical protein ACHWQZ_G016676 [Mnemiopsis leidyi]
MTSYPPTCQEILDDDRPAQPPSYEESLTSNSRAAGKPERPAPPYCTIDQTSRPVPTPTYPPAGGQYPQPAGGQYPQPAGGQYPPQLPVGQNPPQTDMYDGQRTICVAGQGPPPVVHPASGTMTGQCGKFEIWLSSKTGVRSCLVTMIMCGVLMIVSWLIGIGTISIFFVILGLGSMGFLIWATYLRRQFLQRQLQHGPGHFYRVEIRQVPA